MTGYYAYSCAAANFQKSYSIETVNTTCNGHNRYLSALPSNSIVVPVAPTGTVYIVTASFSGAGCTGALVNSSICLLDAVNSHYCHTLDGYGNYVSISKCTAPANGTCNGHNFNACPTAGLTFATRAPAAHLDPNFNKVLFKNNVCHGGKQGGTVFVVKDLQTTTDLFGPQIPHYNQRVVFVDNTAAVGSKVATQTTSLRSTTNRTTIIVTDYNLFLRPSLVFNLVDSFNNINTTDFATTVSNCFPILSHLALLYPTLTCSNPAVTNSCCPGHCERIELPLRHWSKSLRISEWCHDCGGKSGCRDI